MWQLCINGIDGKNHVVKIKTNEPERTTVKRLKELVHEETGIEPEHQRLLYGAKQMEDLKCLGDYRGLRSGASILLVLRLPGGGNRGSTLATDHSKDTRSHSQSTHSACSARRVSDSIPRSDKHCVVCYETGNSVKMPCGHPVCPDCVVEYSLTQIDQKKIEINCPGYGCEKEWPIGVVLDYGGVTDAERKRLEDGMNINACRKDPKTQRCPFFCGMYCNRDNPMSNNVRCIECSRKAGKSMEFCWVCLQPWIAPSIAETCGNQNCVIANDKLQRLQKSPMTPVAFLNGKQIYQLRACPNCGTIIELDSGCKHMTCKCCKIEFCFVCLQQRVDGMWPCGRFDTNCELAPIQQVLPKRKN